MRNKKQKPTHNLMLTVVVFVFEYFRIPWCLPFLQKKKEQEENSPLLLWCQSWDYLINQLN